MANHCGPWDNEFLELIKVSLEHVLKTTPPQPTYGVHDIHVYLFFSTGGPLSHVQVAGHCLMHWTRQYLEGDRGEVNITTRVGINSKKLARDALTACLSKDEDDVTAFLSKMPIVLGPYPDSEKDLFGSEFWEGRAGTLYFFAVLLEDPTAQVSEKILSDSIDQDERGWMFYDLELTGSGHGAIGITTQLVVATPSLALRLKTKLRAVLDLQVDGDWPSNIASAGYDNPFLMQWCHGASRFVFSLKALWPYFPDMQGQIDHFLSLVTVEATEEAKRLEPGDFSRADYGPAMAITFKYHSSVAWTWAVCEQKDPLMLVQTDI
ncbi:hypothetical protein M441DRAFT_65736 [Trichoderma asperellum CBS 433.97]|uniref:Uncharacterized protein n=1 Tax=Trichoderma asperellum (strain ATCC 204424 / CBS 433.97 / NBRC 101777) TaxID=1042311 RepID=A0A2T3ZGM3_TRIA4|nr:hypothetical protein M441DRAFT_65736 [Trichoderma asperellum CBS 433.97]PTB43954.1 hypothetical protein M441DRAFT_65736 [Trichoderma asperellum CBS 433.97]